MATKQGVGVLLLSGIGLAYLLWPDPETRPVRHHALAPAVAPAAPQGAVPRQSIQPAAQGTGQGIFASPFGRGAPAPEAEDEISARDRRMRQAGYATPERYHHLAPPELVAMAKSGDINAMLQLGERYYYENLEKMSPGASPYPGSGADIGKRYFIDAVNAGHHGAAPAISRLYAQEGNPISAYAWELVQARMNLPASSQAPSGGAGLNSSQQQQAQQLARELWTAATLRLAPTS